MIPSQRIRRYALFVMLMVACVLRAQAALVVTLVSFNPLQIYEGSQNQVTLDWRITNTGPNPVKMTFLGNGSVFTISGGNPDSTDNFGFGFFQVGAKVGDVLNKDAFFFFRIPVKTPDLKPEPKEEATPDFGQWTVSGRGYKVSGQDTVLGGASFDSNDFPDATIIVLDEGSPKFNPSPEPSAKVLFAPACLALLAYCWKRSSPAARSRPDQVPLRAPDDSAALPG